jgi:hypothetical protein
MQGFAHPARIAPTPNADDLFRPPLHVKPFRLIDQYRAIALSFWKPGTTEIRHRHGTKAVYYNARKAIRDRDVTDPKSPSHQCDAVVEDTLKPFNNRQ